MLKWGRRPHNPPSSKGLLDPPLTAQTRRLACRVSDGAQKTTPLYDEHVRRGVKMVSFGGWFMPVQYTSIVEEHRAVRNNIGIFDISHMGQLIFDGSGARDWLNTMLTNNIDKLDVGTGQYTFLLNDAGGIIDDLIAYRIGDDGELEREALPCETELRAEAALG